MAHMIAELQQLKDIHLPHTISMLPIAPGWIMLFTAIPGLACYLFYIWYQRKKRYYTVKHALSQLEKLKTLAAENAEEMNIAAEVSTLIRRTALYYFHREEVAGLSGNDWLIFLNRSGSTTHFTEESGQLLIDAPYRKSNETDLTLLFTLTKSWLLAISKIKRMEK